jgi:signal transduction histidine kinase
MGWLPMLRKEGVDPAVVARAIDSIERNAALQARLVDDLLDISRIVAGKVRLECRPEDVGSIARAAIETARPAAEKRNIVLAVAIDTPVTVHGDAARLQQVIGNLLNNALKFTPEKGRVDVRVTGEGGEAIISVSDTGKGIRPDFLPFVFDAFRQGEDPYTRKPGSGLGLGLAIVQHLVQAHGGRVTAQSAGDGLGAMFTVRLPMHGSSDGV